jgi:hypothetical protein
VQSATAKIFRVGGAILILLISPLILVTGLSNVDLGMGLEDRIGLAGENSSVYEKSSSIACYRIIDGRVCFGTTNGRGPDPGGSTPAGDSESTLRFHTYVDRR